MSADSLNNVTWGLLLSATAAVMSFVLSFTQSLLGAKVGSDHPVHAFLARGIRQNGHRLFVRIPKLLNTAYCAALPLYIHWMLSFVSGGALYWAERLLNPVVNMVHVAICAAIAAWAVQRGEATPLLAGLMACLFALTPQFFHALSARNFGLSARGTGLLLLTLFFAAVFGIESDTLKPLAWSVLLLTGWLIWSFSTFGQQALCILSALLLLTTGRVTPLVGAAAGLAIFLLLHPVYGRAYLVHTLKFIQVYASELAPIYILNRRPSIWRDLVRDIWLKFRQTGLKNGFRYAYENSVLVLLLLNPLVVLAAASRWLQASQPAGLLAFAADLALCGLLAMLLTSLRATRFLGEPERYVEVVTPWAVLAGASLLAGHFGLVAVGLLCGLFLVMNLAQLQASRMLVRYITGKPVRLADVEQAVLAAVPGAVRCCSNNEQYTKMLMQNDWWFSYCIAVGQDYCGMKVSQAFSSFPFLRREACERIVATYRINVCVLDRTLYDTLFDVRPDGLLAMETVHESQGLRVLVLRWDDR